MSTHLFQLISNILDLLFLPEVRRLNAIKLQITEKNSKLIGRTFYGFRYEGDTYVPEELFYLARMSRQTFPPVSPELLNETDSFVTDLKIINKEKAQISQLLVLLLEPCRTRQEIRDALPDCLSSLVPDLESLSRTMDDPTWSIAHNPRAMRLYNKLLPKIQTYAAARLLY